MSKEQRPYSPAEIADQILGFPAFADAKKMKKNPAEIFQVVVEAYELEQLTEEQDLIFEAILYFNHISDDFDVRRALAVWSAADFARFQSALPSYREMSRKIPKLD